MSKKIEGEKIEPVQIEGYVCPISPPLQENSSIIQAIVDERAYIAEQISKGVSMAELKARGVVRFIKPLYLNL